MDTEFAIGKRVFYNNKICRIKTMPSYVHEYNYWSVEVTDGYIVYSTDMASIRLIPDSEEVTDLKSKNEHYKKLLERVLPIVDGTVVREHLTIDLGPLAKEIKETLSKN